MTLRLEPIPPDAARDRCTLCGARAGWYLRIRTTARLVTWRVCHECREYFNDRAA